MTKANADNGLTELKRLDQPLVFHFRIGKSKEMEPKTGATVIFLPDRRRFGVSLCCAKDRYQRSVGIQIASARAQWDITEGFSKGSKQPKRNSYCYDYSGPLTLQHVRAVAKGLVHEMAINVNNRIDAFALVEMDDFTRDVFKRIDQIVAPVD